MMSRGYGAMLFKKSAAGLDHLKQNVSKFLKQPFVILLETLPAIQATRRLHMAPCAKRDAQRVPRQLGVSMGETAADLRCAADPHLFSPASAAAFLRATSRVGRSNWW